MRDRDAATLLPYRGSRAPDAGVGRDASSGFSHRQVSVQRTWDSRGRTGLGKIDVTPFEIRGIF
jgi:hypothetical protein